MNGEVNGTMEDIEKTPNSEIIQNKEKIHVKTIECEEYENEHWEDSKNSNQLENDCSEGPSAISNLSDIENDSNEAPKAGSELVSVNNTSILESNLLSSTEFNNEPDNNSNPSSASVEQQLNSKTLNASNRSVSECDMLSPHNSNNDLDNFNIGNESKQQQVNSKPAKFSSGSAQESPQEYNNDLDNNISNDSYPESMSSQGKSVVSDLHVLHNIDEKSKDFEKVFNKNLNTNSQDSYEEGESEGDSSNEGGSEGEPRAGDTVSIGSESEAEVNDDTSQETKANNKVNALDNITFPVNHLTTTEIHEIESDNDDCVVTNDEKMKAKNVENSVPLRRSSRAIKRKRYTDDLDNCDDDTDLEEVPMKSLKKNKPIVINDTKALVEMAARQMKSNHGQNQKKEPTVVIIDTNSTTLPQKLPSKAFGLSIKYKTQDNLSQSMHSYGTTVTSMSNKANSTSNSHAAQPSILPSLTDDMFVVEAPSFIVPYVYEKPSFKPFREFVDLLGKELEEQKAKADKDLLEKQKAAKEKREQEKREKREKGEDIEESEEEIDPEEATHSENLSTELDDKKKKKEKKERRKRNIDDDASWDGESSAESDDDIISDEEGKTVIIKEKEDLIDFKDVTKLTAEKVCSIKTDNYFDCSLGKFFVDIGLNLVQEYVQSDLLKQQNRKLYREKKLGQNTKSTEISIASLSKNVEFSKENNAPYKFKYKKCEFCSFKTESILALAHHLETPHMKTNCYKCNFCSFEVRSPHDILNHMQVVHSIRGRLERAPSCHQCPNCPFEDNGKGKLARHQISCAKKFKPGLNLSPPVEWEPPAKIPKMPRARNHIMGGSYQNAFVRTPINNNMNRPNLSVGNMQSGMISTPRPRAKIPVLPAARPVTRIFQGGVMIRQTTPIPISSNLTPKPKSMHQPSISITPLPRQPHPIQQQPQPQPSQTKGTFVICEICDGYIKDLEQLRNHMQWIHKVKIHPKMIYNRPPLNCQKCQFRFFTDQGLERHLLGSHGLVTSSMQEAANKGKDAGRCPVCGRVYQWKLLNHVGRDHNLTLKPAHLSYKCTVCTATFSMYKQFENHVYSAHSVVAKRVIDKNKASAITHKPNNDGVFKPLKINDEITIIPQSSKNSTSVKDK